MIFQARDWYSGTAVRSSTKRTASSMGPPAQAGVAHAPVITNTVLKFHYIPKGLKEQYLQLILKVHGSVLLLSSMWSQILV